MTSFLLLWFVLHPFHVGLADINYNSNSETYQVSIKLFTDDLEKGLEEFSGVKLDLVDSDLTAESDSVISKYVDDYFQLSSTSKIDLQYIGSEKDYDVTWIYLESDKTEAATELNISNELLMSVYSDQTHIIHYTVNGEINSELIHSEKTIVYFNIKK
jgi:hypothetical protein